MDYLTVKQVRAAPTWWKTVKQIPWKPISFPQQFWWVAWSFLVFSLLFPVFGFLDVSLLAFGISVSYYQQPCVWDDLRFGYWFALSLTILGQLFFFLGIIKLFFSRFVPEKTTK